MPTYNKMVMTDYASAKFLKCAFGSDAKPNKFKIFLYSNANVNFLDDARYDATVKNFTQTADANGSLHYDVSSFWIDTSEPYDKIAKLCLYDANTTGYTWTFDNSDTNVDTKTIQGFCIYAAAANNAPLYNVMHSPLYKKELSTNNIIDGPFTPGHSGDTLTIAPVLVLGNVANVAHIQEPGSSEN